jgi:NAD(P)-dependent dehydrogenase (short-subunit alcohol dehydrogenase family)
VIPRRVVITGAGGGIGAAMARRFAADGAEVVVNDRDPIAAQQVAAEVHGIAIAGDVAIESDMQNLVDTAWAEMGGIDLFCGNAGTLSPGGEDTPDSVWLHDFHVNVLSHVYATRALLPRWLADNSGRPKRLLITVSAAGLLTLLGSAPYAVTKHAALAYAEWLRVTYGHRGLIVQALCPQGVNTDMLRSDGDSPSKALLTATALEPAAVAEVVAKALDGESFLILPHPEVAEFYRRRATDPDRWLGGMNKMQREFEA